MNGGEPTHGQLSDTNLLQLVVQILEPANRLQPPDASDDEVAGAWERYVLAMSAAAYEVIGALRADGRFPDHPDDQVEQL